MSDDKTATVLVVDDEPLVLMHAVEIIEDAGWRALQAEDPAEALAAFHANPDIDVLFTDINMPGDMDGLALAACVHQLRPQVHLVITSGKRMLADSSLPGGGTFLPKPYGYHHLLEAIGTKLSTGSEG